MPLRTMKMMKWSKPQQREVVKQGFPALVVDDSEHTAVTDLDGSLTSFQRLSPDAVQQQASSASSTESSNKNSKKSVSFSSLHIHSYALTLGDNPACSSGAPICLSNQCVDERQISVDDYEAHLPPRRTTQEMIMGRMDREEVLRYAGFGRADLRERADEMRQIQLSRERNAASAAPGSKNTKGAFWGRLKGSLVNKKRRN